MAGKGSRPGERRGGRAPGVPNKRTVELIDRLAELNCDPVEGLAKIAIAPNTDATLRARVYADLLPYIYPRRKSVELTMERPNLFDGVPLPDVQRIVDRLRAHVRQDAAGDGVPSRANRFKH